MSTLHCMCPGILSVQDIVNELTCRGIKLNESERNSRDKLTALFIKHVMPLPQRRFPNNHQGKLINNMVRDEDRKSRKHVTEETESSMRYGFVDGKRPKLSSPSKNDRLKPPIDSTNIQHKISLKSVSSSSSSLDRVLINKRSPGSASERRMSSDDDGVKVDLKRRHSESEKTDEPLEKKPRQKIAWP